MPERRRLQGALNGLAEGIQDVAKMQMSRRLQNEQQDKTQANERLNQLLSDFDTSARAITTPEHVGKVGADTARSEYSILKRRLPKGVIPLLGEDPNFDSLDSSVEERQGGLMKDIGSITNPDDVSLTPMGVRGRAAAARVPTDVKFPMLGSSPQSDATQEDPEFTKLLGLVQGQKEGLLNKESTDEATDVNTGVQHFSTARERNAPGFTGTKVALTPDEEVAKTVKTTRQNAQATADVENDPTNQKGKARGAGLIAGSDERARLKAQLDQMGITGQQQTGALQLSDDFEKADAPYIAVRTSLKNIQALARQAQTNPLSAPQADIGIVYSIMTAMDPGSHVLAGEQATAQNTAGVPEMIRQKYNKMLTGETLTGKERQGFVSTARTLFTQAAADHQERVRDFTGRAAQIRVPPSMVVRELADPTLGTSKPSEQTPLERARAAGGQ